MHTRSHVRLQLALVIAGVMMTPAASFAQVNVLMSNGFSAAYQKLLPEFERSSGTKVVTTSGSSQGNGPTTIGAQLQRGVSADVVIMNRAGLDDLIKDGRIVAGSDIDLAQTVLGVAVRAGAPKPDISTAEAFKQALLRAQSVTFDGSTSGMYLTGTLFPRLGIAAELAGKSTTAGVASVGRGEAEIAVQPVSEILPVQGVDYVGTIPAELQYVGVFSAAVVTGSKQPDAARRLIAYLASEQAITALRSSGMEPAKRK